MGQVIANGIQIEAERVGSPDAPALLLVRGLGTQMIQWPETFVDALARERNVILFDNRDVGKSQKFDSAGVPDLAKLMSGGEAAVPYLLKDMAADAIGVLDAFDVDSAHIFGMSMGGMIVQQMAADFPERVRSLISMMSTSSDPSLPPPTPAAMAFLMGAPERPDDRECAVEHGLAGRRVIGSPGYPDTDEAVRDELGRAFDRSRDPDGVARQMAAIAASGSRVEILKGITAPTLVIHGADDPLVKVEGGLDTARHIPGAALEVIDGLGHDLPRGLVPRLVDLILRHTDKADSAA
ncbi:MAG: alpha/beta fold hydrolase [Myxococcota bacterium]|nr:alpha/beta fold hydrolase [Myxococcota bacterium]